MCNTMQVRLYFQRSFALKTTDEDEVLRLMPPPMRRELLTFVFKDLVSEMLLFRG
eukprot:SAG11_NODE_4163_length_2030_cov_1.321595_4_plen_55_part_00